MKIILVPIFSNHVQSLMECDRMNVIPKIDPILNITREERGEGRKSRNVHTHQTETLRVRAVQSHKKIRGFIDRRVRRLVQKWKYGGRKSRGGFFHAGSP